MNKQTTSIFTDELKNEALWKIAKKRACFKQYFVSAFFLNSFLVGVWLFTNGVHSYFWPGWAILGWGASIFIQFADAYLNNDFFSKEKEYLKLKQNAGKNG